MGMFDWYRPTGVASCPACGEVLGDWQGTDGPCGLFVWEQGEMAPVDQLVDEEVRLEEADRRKCRLPGVFRLYAYCRCGRRVDAEGGCDRGVWTSTRLMQDDA
jgi:hypothetical protein